jgi:sigma-B regulation protein RsbU (phosphoserine phosphatase)
MGPKLKERLHLRRDMELASEVQNLLLPKSTPDLSGFDLAGGIAYCDQTGGDYYDFIEFDADDSHGLAVVVGDVSGHGAASSLIMAEARGQLHALSGQSMTPKERIRTVNRFLSRDMDGTGRFLTLFYLRLIKDSGLVRWVRAGHDPAMRYNPATDEFGELGGDGLALGVLGDFEYEDYEAELASGEVVVICTDGVWEARNAEGVMFGKERILDLIRENAHTCCEEIRRAIMRSVDAYQGDGQVDDIAVVVIKKD